MNTTFFRDAVRLPSQLVLSPDFDAIEAARLPEMGAHWCVWQLHERPGRSPKKPPYDGYRAIDSQKPEQWISYTEAKRLYLAGGWDGIGFLPQDANMIVGLDADKVLDENTGVLSSGAEIVERLERIGCYLELSPSGLGIRGFVLGVKDGKSKVTVDGHSVECYQSSETNKDNYVTVTGHCWSEVKPVAVDGGQAKLESFLLWSGLMSSGDGEVKAVGKVKLSDEFEGWVRRSDDEVLRLMLGSLNPQGKYSRLMDGDLSDYNWDVSEARFGLLTQLAYITRDDEQIERIVRGSKLDSSKFDEKRSGYRNFLHYDIARALKVKDRNYDIDRFEKSEVSERKQVAAVALKAKAKNRLHGGFDGLLGDGGKLKGGMHTVSELLIRDQQLIGCMWFDEFAGMPKKAISFADAFGDRCAPKTSGQLEDDDLLAVTAWMRTQWGLVAEERNIVMGAVRRWARYNSLNMVTDRLEQFSNNWDGIERLGSWLIDYLGVKVKDGDEDMAYYLAEVGKRFLVGVVARVFVPGTQQDQMLIFENADGGEGKTAAVRILGKGIDESAFLEGFSPSENKDCYLKMRGKALGDWGELAGFDARESAFNKDFLTRAQDDYRDPYGALNKTWPRTISFIATTNRDDYLKDTGGKRRYWPVRVGFVDLVKLQRDVQQLWGEAVRLYQSDFQFWIDKNSPADARFRAQCDKEQHKRLVATSYDDLANDLADRLVRGIVAHPEFPDMKATHWMAFSVLDMQKMLIKDGHEVSKSEWHLAAAALKRQGWSNGDEFRLPGNNRGWGLTSAKVQELRAFLQEDAEPESTEAEIMVAVKRMKSLRRKNKANCRETIS